jgi:RNA polymerase sigma-70 factor (ECF subfamily)
VRSAREIECELLLLRCHRGDANAFTALTRLWERRLLYYIRRLVRTEEDAWDVLQEVWIKVWGNVGSVRDAASLRPWLYRVAHNAAVSHMRYESRIEALSEALEEVAATGCEPAFDSDEADRIHRALDRLAPLQREVLTLVFLEEFSHVEVADILGIPVGTVKSRLFYAKQALRALLDAEKSP